MNNKKIIVGSLVVAVVLLGAASISWAASSNYTGWRAFMGNRAPSVTEQNFDRYTEMQKSVVDGNYDEAAKIRTEIGLGSGQGGCQAAQNGGGCGMHKQGNAEGGCPMAKNNGDDFVDTNKDGVCDNHNNLK